MYELIITIKSEYIPGPDDDEEYIEALEQLGDELRLEALRRRLLAGEGMTVEVKIREGGV